MAAFVSFCLFTIILYKIQRGSKNLKFITVALFGFCVCGTTIYAFKQSQVNRKVVEFQKAFYENNVLACYHDNTIIPVQKKHFIYLADSLVFLGKDSRKGTSVNILECQSYEKPENDAILTD